MEQATKYQVRIQVIGSKTQYYPFPTIAEARNHMLEAALEISKEHVNGSFDSADDINGNESIDGMVVYNRYHGSDESIATITVLRDETSFALMEYEKAAQIWRTMLHGIANIPVSKLHHGQLEEVESATQKLIQLKSKYDELAKGATR